MRKLVLLTLIAFTFACAKHETTTPNAPPSNASSKPAAQTTSAATATTQTTSSAAAATTTADVGQAMPPYTTELLDGKKFDMAAERGNVVFLNLWATWCGPCRFEIPELQSLHQKYASRGFKVVGISLDDTGVGGVKQFVSQHSMTYPVAYDPEGKIAAIFESSVLPTSVIVDRSGQIVWKKFGAVSMDDPTLKDALTKALDAKS
ncbi:MAG TPA: TlpA disulfide reductase family protein [Thermoanaerobaculia bacterium]|nr:TlpA disulfide reductase family protein [Thermoanaerobaculia bacterium]